MMRDTTKFTAIARAIVDAGGSTDSVLAALRVEGATMSESCMIVREVLAVPLGTAKQVVDGSPVWSDMSEANEKLREEGIDFLRDYRSGKRQR